MRIDQITIEGVGGIEKIELAFDSKMNILCGPNGIGKTTILESVAHVFCAGETRTLRRNAKMKGGCISAGFEVGGSLKNVELKLFEFSPSRGEQLQGAYQYSNDLIYLKAERGFQYVLLNSVSRDAEKPSYEIWADSRNGISTSDVKNWFVNRYLYSRHETLSPEQLSNFALARSSFSALNSNYSFSRVDPSTNEIMVNTPSGEVYLEYLSSGFKSCLAMIFGIIKEVEFRFKEPKIKSEDFAGLVLIDEIELHLHPEWQSVICSVLLQCFPKVQFICTTHSPHVIQAADPNQILAIEVVDGCATRRMLPDSKYGFKGWTVEEVLTDVMGMKDLRTEEFTCAVSRFEKALDVEDAGRAEEVFNQLDQMIHPRSSLRKMFRIQLGAIRGARD